MSEMWYGAALGIVQGLTEFLPVSSSGHLIVFSWFTDGKPIPLALDVALHLGTLGAVAAYFFRDWLQMGQSVWQAIRFRQLSFEVKTLLPALLLGTIPIGLLGVLFKDPIELYFHRPAVVAIPLAVVGLILWIVDRRSPQVRSLEQVTLRDGILIGLCQCAALVPGVSRSGSTIIAGRLLGLRRADAAKLSFLMGTPAMTGAVLLESKHILAHLHEPVFFMGIGVSFAVGCFAIALLLKILGTRDLGIFAVYRILVAIFIWSMVR